MWRVAIAEDDQVCLQTVRACLDRFTEETGTEFSVTAFANGMDLTENYRLVYDILILDIEMPLLDGMSAAEHIREKDPDVLLLFVTNLAQYAIRGYGVDALDYMLKPVTYPAMAMKLRKACRILESRVARFAIIRYQDELIKLPSSSILYVEVLDHQLVYHTLDGDYMEFNSLRNAQSALGEGFSRCNQCYLVNLRHVTGIRGDCVIVGEQSLKISRNRKKQFVQELTDYCRFGGR